MERWLRSVCARVLAGALLCAIGGCRHPDAPPRAGEGGVDLNRSAAYAAALLRETNRVRGEHGLAPLRAWPRLDAAAEDHAAFMALRLHLSHTSDLPGQATPAERVRRQGIEAVAAAENVAYFGLEDGDTPDSIAARFVELWLNSPGHRQNLLNRHVSRFGGAVRLAKGVGQTRYAFGVQLFVEPKGR